MSEQHGCRKYVNARGEVVDPADQGGIGCTVCLPPDGRAHRDLDEHDLRKDRGDGGLGSGRWLEGNE